MKHRGEIVEKAVRDSGVSISALANKLGKSRRHIYNLFQYHNLDWETISHIGEIINFDFTLKFPELAKQNISIQSAPNDLKSCIEQMHYWKDKYISLLEEYNKILKTK
jgi:predicted transcriptional regulator